MTDALAILVSCCMLAFVVIRAIKLDARLPWFEPLGGRRPGATAPDGAVAPKTVPHQGMLSSTKNDLRSPREEN